MIFKMTPFQSQRLAGVLREFLTSRNWRREHWQGGTLCQGGSYEQFAIERNQMMTASWRESPFPLYGSAGPVKVVRNRTTRCARVFLFAAPPLTVLAEPGSLPLGFRAGTCGQTL